MQAVVQRMLEEPVSLTATQLQTPEIILISFLVWSIYSKTISGLTKILEQHLHRGFREVEGVAFMLACSKSELGRLARGKTRGAESWQQPLSSPKLALL